MTWPHSKYHNPILAVRLASLYRLYTAANRYAAYWERRNAKERA